MMPAILIAFCACTLAFDFRKNLRARPIGEKVVYLALMLIGFAVLMLNEFGVPIPSPAFPIQNFIKSMTGTL